MMYSLFSSFDFFYHYLVTPIVLIQFYLIFSQKMIFSMGLEMKSMMVSYLSNFFYNLKFKSFSKLSMVSFLCMFFYIFSLNFTSVMSFVFPITSQVSFVLLIGLLMWCSFNMFLLFNNHKMFISHMIPQGAPTGLSVFLFAIEMVSNLIRPLTLTIRLVANILAGHLLMILLFKLVLLFNISMVAYTMLNLVEIFVSLIQSYIFSTLLVLYYSDIN